MPARARTWFVVLLTTLAAVWGCEPEVRVVRSTWSQLKADSKGPAGNSVAAKRTDGNWAILLTSYEGASGSDQAQEMLTRLQSAGLTDVWAHKEANGRTYLYRGHYANPFDPAIQLELQQTRDLNLSGQRPLAGANLVSLAEGGRDRLFGSAAVPTGSLDVSQFHGMFTLQIGFYDEDFGPDFRKAAEKAVTVLRDEGEQAYYYHGRHSSLVTIGLFTAADLEDQEGGAAYGSRVRKLQEKYPYNLGNGLTLVEKTRDGRKLRDQPSFLVKVP